MTTSTRHIETSRIQRLSTNRNSCAESDRTRPARKLGLPFSAIAGPSWDDSALRDQGARGFTLSEVVIAATLSVFILAGVLSAFLFIGRTSFAASNYSELESEARRGLEVFAEDVRMAHDIRWNSPQSVTLVIAGSSGPTTVTYAYDGQTNSPTHRSFYRVLGNADSIAPRRALIRNLAPDFSFKRYKLEQPGVIDNTAGSDLETKQIQLTLRAIRSGSTVAATTNSVVSARYVLRNKRVSE